MFQYIKVSGLFVQKIKKLSLNLSNLCQKNTVASFSLGHGVELLTSVAVNIVTKHGWKDGRYV